MSTEENINYKRIEAAISFIKNNFKRQPSLEEIAQEINLSPSHFQRLFTEWAGTSPKKFLQYISVAHAKSILQQNQKATLFDITFETGLSSTSRLHDLFIQIEGMTPAEYKNGGKNLMINYSFFSSPFGELIIASTAKGICYMAFEEDMEFAFQHLETKFPNATFLHQQDEMHKSALHIFEMNKDKPNDIKLHLKGTPFQLKVWESLLNIPTGKLATYGELAQRIGNPQASRAVGTAIGSNPVAFIIPCHRVIQATGNIGGYMWNPIRKTAIIGWEAAQVNNEV